MRSRLRAGRTCCTEELGQKSFIWSYDYDSMDKFKVPLAHVYTRQKHNSPKNQDKTSQSKWPSERSDFCRGRGDSLVGKIMVNTLTGDTLISTEDRIIT